MRLACTYVSKLQPSRNKEKGKELAEQKRVRLAKKAAKEEAKQAKQAKKAKQIIFFLMENLFQ